MNEIAATLIVVSSWHVPCLDGTPHAVACTMRLWDRCTITVGQRYERLGPHCRDLVLAHEARHCMYPHEHGPVGGVLAECLGGVDLTAWASRPRPR